MSRTVDFVVSGLPRPGGSKRILPLGGKPGGRPIIVDASGKTRPWRTAVAAAARAAMEGQQALAGPLELMVVFSMPRPKSHYLRDRLRPTAPTFHTNRPDATKLVRAIEDSLTGIVYRDDAQIVRQYVVKRYGERPYAGVFVSEIQVDQLELRE